MSVIYKVIIFCLFIFAYAFLGIFGNGTNMNFQYLPTVVFGVAVILGVFFAWELNLRNLNLVAVLFLFTALIYFMWRAYSSEVVYLARKDVLTISIFASVFLLTFFVFTESVWRFGFIYLLGILAVTSMIFIWIQQENHSFNSLWWLGYKRTFAFTERTGSGLYNLHNHMAGFMHPVALLCLGVLVFSRLKAVNYIIFGFIFLVSSFCLFISTSRGGYIAYTCGIGAFAFLFLYLKIINSQTRMLMKLGVMFCIVCFFVFVWLFGSGTVKLPVAITDKMGGDNRTMIWDSVAGQVGENKLIGTGARSFEYFSYKYWSKNLGSFHNAIEYAHNDYLQTMADYGMIGLFFICVVLLLLIYVSFDFLDFMAERVELGRDDRLGLVVGAVSVIGAYGAHSFVDFNMHLPSNAVLVAFAMGIAFNPNIKNRQVEREINLGAYVFSMLVVIFGSYIGGKYIYSGYFFEKARVGAKRNSKDYLKNLLNSKKHDEYNYQILARLAQLRLSRSDRVPDIAKMSYYVLATKGYENYLKLYPYSYRNMLSLAGLYDYIGSVLFYSENVEERREAIEKINKATLLYKRAVQWCPRKEVTHNSLANHLVNVKAPLYVNRGQVADAVEALKTAKKHYEEADTLLDWGKKNKKNLDIVDQKLAKLLGDSG